MFDQDAMFDQDELCSDCRILQRGRREFDGPHEYLLAIHREAGVYRCLICDSQMKHEGRGVWAVVHTAHSPGDRRRPERAGSERRFS
jgi:hypothetical protein